MSNLSSKSIYFKDIRKASSLKNKLLGLLILKPPLLLKTRFGIHTFFMKYPIDVLILDRKFKVVKLKENLKPYKLFFWNPKYYHCIELKPQTIKLSKIHLGDSLKF